MQRLTTVVEKLLVNRQFFNKIGIRNALIKNFNDVHLRANVGVLWKNFCVHERMKHNHYTGRMVNPWFWRTYDQKELDFVEESGGRFAGFEFKCGGESTRGYVLADQVCPGGSSMSWRIKMDEAMKAKAAFAEQTFGQVYVAPAT
jgi:hypothetical protein